MKWVTESNKTAVMRELAAELRKVPELKQPDWAIFVKTGASRERVPQDMDWWQVRAASIMLKASMHGPIGVNKLRTKYGGRKRRGHAPPEFRQASGNIIRKIMQQLEGAGLLEQKQKGVHKGRVVTAKGMSLLNQAAKRTVPKAKTAQKKPLDTAEKREKAEVAGQKQETVASKPKKTRAKTQKPKKQED